MISNKKSHIRDWIFAILWGGLVTVLLCIPGNNLPETGLDKIPFFDKYVHIGLFAVLTFSWCVALFNLKRRDAASMLVFKVAVIIVVYGTAMEFVQKYLVAMRSFDITDILADAVGALLGVAIFRRLNIVASH